MTDYLSFSLTNIREAIQNKDVKPTDLVEACYARIEETKALNAYITLTKDHAFQQAEIAEKKIKNGDMGRLEGIPLANKDLFCTKNELSTAASKILSNFISPYESTVTQKLKDDGAISLGKLNLDEFAMGSANNTSFYGQVFNPWRGGDNEDLVPGGSSGGSAAAVAAYTCFGATGTDTGGSIRQPASFCGIVGIKPTYGRCSRRGVIAFASSLDQAGVFARTVEDTALLLQSISGHDPLDSTSEKRDVPNWFERLKSSNGLKGKIIGIPKEYQLDDTPKDILNLWKQGQDWVKDAGATVKHISLPHTKYALPTYYIINPAEASSNLARYDGMRYGTRIEGENLIDTYIKTRTAGFGDEVKRRLMIGAFVLSAGYMDAYYIQAQKVRHLIRQDFMKAFDECDAILTPTTPSAAFGVDEKQSDPVQMYLNDIFTVPANIAGLPGISVPAGLNEKKLPLGLQLIGRPWDELTLFETAKAIENASNFKGLDRKK